MSDQPSNQSNYNLPGNSHKKADGVPETEVRTPKFEKSITGTVVERKKPLGKRIAETFTGDDSRSVGHFVLFEVVLPAAKQMIVDAGSQGLERMFYGESNRGRNAPMNRGGGSGYNYNRPTSIRQDIPRQQALSQKSRATHDFRDIVLETRGEAERIRDDLVGAIETYGSTTVSDLYEFVGITGSFQDDKWGWYDLRDVRIQRVREGYMINLPRPAVIE